ncbi:hypothetical protein EB008_03695 [bacterium]|nr:hypothetical protein [bacterium]
MRQKKQGCKEFFWKA